MDRSDILELTQFVDRTTDELINALALVTNLRINAANFLALHQRDYDRTLANRYYQSEANSHAARLREGEYHAQEDRDECTEWANQLNIHALTAEFLIHLIEWRDNGKQGTSGLQRRFGSDPEARGGVQGGGERDSGVRSAQGFERGETPESSLEASHA